MKASTITKETILYRDLPTRSYPQFSAGDRIIVSQKIKEGDKERIQAFEGDVIAIHNNGISSTFVVRKLSANGVYVERIFPYYAPTIAEITVVRRGKVRRAKLYYMRDRVGKSARIEELIVTKEQKKDAAV